MLGTGIGRDGVLGFVSRLGLPFGVCTTCFARLFVTVGVADRSQAMFSDVGISLSCSHLLPDGPSRFPMRRCHPLWRVQRYLSLVPQLPDIERVEIVRQQVEWALR